MAHEVQERENPKICEERREEIQALLTAWDKEAERSGLDGLAELIEQIPDEMLGKSTASIKEPLQQFVFVMNRRHQRLIGLQELCGYLVEEDLLPPEESSVDSDIFGKPIFSGLKRRPGETIRECEVCILDIRNLTNYTGILPANYPITILDRDRSRICPPYSGDDLIYIEFVNPQNNHTDLGYVPIDSVIDKSQVPPNTSPNSGWVCTIRIDYLESAIYLSDDPNTVIQAQSGQQQFLFGYLDLVVYGRWVGYVSVEQNPIVQVWYEDKLMWINTDLLQHPVTQVSEQCSSLPTILAGQPSSGLLYPVFGSGSCQVPAIVANPYSGNHPAIDIVPIGAFERRDNSEIPYIVPEWDRDPRYECRNKVYAVATGTFETFDPYSARILVNEGDTGLQIRYVHFVPSVPNGTPVQAGDEIGTIINYQQDPNSGAPTHLHFAVYNINGVTYYDPSPYISTGILVSNDDKQNARSQCPPTC